MINSENNVLAGLTSEIVAAYVAQNHVQPGDVPDLIAAVHGTLAKLGKAPAPVAAEPPKPPVPIRRTVTDEYLVSLEDGKRYKALKRHLGKLGLTPEAYRTKWGLPHDYPMVSAAYSRNRSTMAKEMGLGNVRRKG